MGERTIFSIFVDSQEPYHGAQQNDRTFDEKIAGFLGPRFIQAHKNRMRGLEGVGYIGH